MLTVKHVHEGVEQIIAAPFGVQYVGPHANWGIGGPHIAIPKGPDGLGSMSLESKVVHGGIAYVMNESGATVGVYQLGDAPRESMCGGQVGGQQAMANQASLGRSAA